MLGASAALGLLTAALYPQDLRGDEFRAIVRATRGNATGLLIVNEGLWGSGGYFYVGRPIPWWTCDWPADPPFQRAMKDPRITAPSLLKDEPWTRCCNTGFASPEPRDAKRCWNADTNGRDTLISPCDRTGLARRRKVYAQLIIRTFQVSRYVR